MAFVTDQEKKDQQQNPGMGLGGDTSNTANQPAQKTSSGSGFVNLQKYLQANKPQQFAQQTAQKVVGLGDTAKQEVAGQQQKFGENLEKAKTGLEEQKQRGSTLLGEVEQIGFGNAPQSADDIQKFQQFIGGSYQGPTGLEDPTKALARARIAQNVGQLAGQQGTAGKTQLLQTFYGRPSYNTGQQGLDSLLLAQGGPKELQQAARTTKGLESNVEQQTSQAEKLGSLQKSQDMAARESQVGQLESGYQSGLSDVRQRQQQLEQSGKNYIQDIQSRLANGGRINADEAKALGVDSGGLVSYGGRNLGEAYQLDSQSLQDLGKVATKQQTARLLGLAKLAGDVVPNLDVSKFGLEKAETANPAMVNQQALADIKQQIASQEQADLATRYSMPGMESAGWTGQGYVPVGPDMLGLQQNVGVNTALSDQAKRYLQTRRLAQLY